MVFLMLNPSTADAEQDDPTIRRCIGFAKREGYGRLQVLNLFAGRATRPADLFAMEDPVGPANVNHIQTVVSSDQPIIVAWGAHPKAQQAYEQFRQIIRFPAMRCLGVCKAGAPRHPLYVRKDQALITWPGSIARIQAIPV